MARLGWGGEGCWWESWRGTRPRIFIFSFLAISVERERSAARPFYLFFFFVLSLALLYCAAAGFSVEVEKRQPGCCGAVAGRDETSESGGNIKSDGDSGRPAGDSGTLSTRCLSSSGSGVDRGR